MKTTLNLIRAQSPCADGWKKLLTHLGKTEADDEPLALLTVLKSNGLDDALWTLRCVPNCDRDARLFAVWCARQVQHLMTDQRSLDALDVAERFANGEATDDELAAAWAAARVVVMDAARDAAWAAARTAARAAARDAAWAAARTAAMDAARAAQKSMFIQMCNGTAPWQEVGK
jgi:hypothetical protein